MHFEKPIYLIWYAAEEVGLVGSNRVITYFSMHHIAVSQVMNLDMTGYSVSNDKIWLLEDYTDYDLVEYLADLIQCIY